MTGTHGSPFPAASLAFSLSPRSKQPLDHHVCSLDPRSLPRWVRAPPRPFPSHQAGWRWGEPSRCLLVAGVCLLLLLPEPAGSEGAGELRVQGSGKQGWVQVVGGAAGRLVEARSDRASGPWPWGPQLQAAAVGAAARRSRIHTHRL